MTALFKSTLPPDDLNSGASRDESNSSTSHEAGTAEPSLTVSETNATGTNNTEVNSKATSTTEASIPVNTAPLKYFPWLQQEYDLRPYGFDLILDLNFKSLVSSSS